MDETPQTNNISITPLENFVQQPAVPTPMPPAQVPQTPAVTETPPVPQEPDLAQAQPSPTPAIQPNMESDKISYADAQIQEIEVAKIVANPFQPRKVFEPNALKELADSRKEHGVIQPLVVTRTPIGFEIVVGERRFRASQLAGLVKVPAIVKEAMVDQTKLEVALIENIQRQELNPIEEGQAYERLMKTFNMTQEQVAKKVGKSRPAIANTIRLLNLPAEIQRGIIEGKVTEGHTRPLLGLQDPERMLSMYKQILDNNWTVRQVEQKVRELTQKRAMDAVMPDPKLMAFETELRGKLGTQVKIQRQGSGGKIMIEFFSDDDLAEIIKRIESAHAAQGGEYLVV